MRQETQRYMHDNKEGVLGDCWRTALACVLDLPRDDVPHVIGDDDWWEQSCTFVTNHTGMLLLNLEPQFPVYQSPESSPYQHVIATGPSPRGDFAHCVVVSAIDGALVWDPHPSRAGLAGPATALSVIGVLP
ncbi:hypothetical protein SEA_AXYM_36 [Gordonia phage Axym]|uniref:Uncharacterized protein n=1 Tax=Gordonia phage Axym TaxID=2653715 RepID=A0A5Q2WGV9_9CAUD|nr:hypothetical protein SEA_AXYM_36 [Gordonia phage Axym]